jgi:hypothetical protein
MFRCPGQDQRFWKPDDIFDIECPGCGTTIEFWKDEPRLKCPRCKCFVANPRLDLGCAKGCKYAGECLGTNLDTKNSDLCSRLIGEIREIFVDDRGRINHALKTLKYAESIQAVEGGEPLVVKAAAILHDISVSGSHPAETDSETHGEVEAVRLAEEILSKHGVNAETVKEICAIIAAHHCQKDIDRLEFRILSDAHKLADFQTTFSDVSKDTASARIAASFETPQGRNLANQLLVDLWNTGKSRQ